MLKPNTMKTQKEIRQAFWQQYPKFKHGYKCIGSRNGRKIYAEKRQNDYNATIRTEFNFFIDNLYENGEISSRLLYRVTL